MSYKLIRKSCFSALSIIFLIFNLNCNNSSNTEEEPIIVTNKVTPINELYKELNFTAIAAHRCYFRKSPENSLASIQDALDLGVEFLETDTRTTADGVVVLFHDSTIDRMTNRTGLVANMNFSSISNLKLKNNAIDGALTDELIPTLEQALLKIKGENIYMHIEVKDKKFSEVVKIVKRTETQNQVVIFANSKDDYNTLDTFVGVFINPVCRNTNDFNFYLGRTNTPLLNLAGEQFNANNTLEAKNKNKLTWRGITGKPEDKELLSGINTTPNLDLMIQKNPAIIHTDYADLMIVYLESKGKR